MPTSKKITKFLIYWPGGGNAVLCSPLRSRKFSLPRHPGTLLKLIDLSLENLGGVTVGPPGCAHGTCTCSVGLGVRYAWLKDLYFYGCA